MKTASGRIEKADVLAYVESRASLRITAASPKARRLAAERGVDLKIVRGSGPGGAILAADVGAAKAATAPEARPAEAAGVSNVWRIMAERMTASWTSAPHIYWVREVNDRRLNPRHGRALKHNGA